MPAQSNTRAVAGSSSAEPNQRAHGDSGRNLPLIAIVDDDGPLRSSLADLMRSAGYAAVEFGSAEDYLGADVRFGVRCLITDIQLPGLSGIDLKRRLDSEEASVPVIIITARVEQYSEQQVKEVGATCFLRKPFEPKALFACVERCLLESDA